MGNETMPSGLDEWIEINPRRQLARGDESVYVSMQDLDVNRRTVPSYGRREFKGSGSRFSNGDTLLARITPCLENGKTAYVDFLEEGEVAHGSTEFIVLSCKAEISDPVFVYYLARSPKFRSFTIKRMEGSSGRQRVPATTLKRFAYNLPSLINQRAIAHILGSLDDKIELNRQMNRTLEKMAQAIFKSWFIDFDPVRRNAARAQNQPSPPAPLPEGEGSMEPSPPAPLPEGEGSKKHTSQSGAIREVEGSKGSSPSGRSGDEGSAEHYRGGFNFLGLVKTARELRQKQTPAEEIFWAIVRNRQFMGLKFRRQHQIGEYVADFYCHEEKLVIELDGGIHAQKKKKDAKRDAYMQAQKFTVLRFKNKELLDDPESVLNQIASFFPKSVRDESSSPSGRGGGEGMVESHAFDHLFPDSFEDSELGEIPKGWEVKPIGDVIEIYDSKRIPLSRKEREKRTGPYPYYGATSIMDYVDDYIFDGIYTLIGEDGSVINEDGTPFMQYVWGKIWVNNHAHVLQGKSYISTEHIYVHLSQANVGAYVTGAVQLKINQGNLKRIPFIRPTEDVAIMFGDVLKRYYSQYRNNVEESRTLSTLRDTLLPKLISGELPIPDAEKILEGVE